MKHSDYMDVLALSKHRGYQQLENEWLHQVSLIEQARDKAAKKGSETAWRYWAGQEAGFKLAMTTLARMIAGMDAESDGESKTDLVDKLLGEIRQ